MQRSIVTTFAAASAIAIAVLMLAPAIAPARTEVRAGELDNPFGKINHFIVIYAENLSFDGIFGAFPGADGLANGVAVAPQRDHDGQIFAALPAVRIAQRKGDGAGAGVYLDKALPNAPFDLEDHLEKGKATGDLVHRFYQEQEQINGGANDRFAAVSDAGGLVMGTYHDENLRLWNFAREFALLDHFHHAAFGGSFLNHFWLVCACTPEYEQALLQLPEAACGLDGNGQPKLVPKRVVCLAQATGFLARQPKSPASAQDGPPAWLNNAQVTPDGYAVNTLQPPYPPFAVEPQLPAQTAPTIGDLLTKAGTSWGWYSGGWNAASAGEIKPYAPPENFQPHHQPLNYFASFAPGTAQRSHLKDESDFLAGIRNGTLPAVAFWKPVGRDTMHPGYTDLWSGDKRIGEVVDLIRQSPAWNDTAIIITMDENGGTWDHVAPPKIDRWGPGVRVPTVLISPYARRGFIDHTIYDTTAILKTIEVRFGLPALGSRDAASADLRAAFDFDAR